MGYGSFFTNSVGVPTVYDGKALNYFRVNADEDEIEFRTPAQVLADIGGLSSSGETAAQILAKLVTVDGAGSGLDADLLDGQDGTYYLPAASYTAADVLAKLLTVDGSGSGLDADKLRGTTPSVFALTTLDDADAATFRATIGAVNIAGDTMTGTLTLTMATPVFIANAAAAGQDAYFLMRTAASSRWAAGKDATSESGANAGSNYYIRRYSDAGAFIDAPFSITRSSGLVSIADGLTVTGTTTLNTALAIGSGGTGSTSASAARTALGLEIGTNVQAFDAELAAIAGLASAADRLPYFTGSGTAALATYTAFARTLDDDADATAARSTLGVVIGTNVQAWDADLDALAALSGTNNIYYRSAANTWSSVTIGSSLSFSGGTLDVDTDLITNMTTATIATGDYIPFSDISNSNLNRRDTATSLFDVMFGAWTTFTPTITAGSGTFTSVSGSGARKTYGKTTWFRCSISITTNGTAAGYTKVDIPSGPLPTTPQAVSVESDSPSQFAGAGRIQNDGGGNCSIFFNKYDNTYLGGDSYSIRITGCYESA